MYPWISRALDFGLQFCEKKCGLYMDVYGTHLFFPRSEQFSNNNMKKFTFNSAVRGYHVYKVVWKPTIGKKLQTDH